MIVSDRRTARFMRCRLVPGARAPVTAPAIYSRYALPKIGIEETPSVRPSNAFIKWSSARILYTRRTEGPCLVHDTTHCILFENTAALGSTDACGVSLLLQ